MSATVTESAMNPAPAPALTEPSRPVRRTSAVLALARFEARELLCQIPVVAFLALYTALVGWSMVRKDGMDDYPVLHMVDRSSQSTPLLLAVALLICVNAAALRSRRHATADQFEMLPMDPWRRTLAHVLSVVPFVLFSALVVMVQFTWEALKPGAVGHGSFGELVVGPLLVLLAGVMGAALARLAPSPFAPILFTVAAYVLSVTLLGPQDVPEGIRRLAPVFGEFDAGGDPVPSDLLDRPAGWHALYLAGLCALLTCVALLRAGGRTRAVRTATAIALAATAAGAIGQLPRDGAALEAARKTVWETPEKVQSCKEYGGSTYCSFPEWDGIRAEWAKTVDRVRSAAGGTAADAVLTVRQRVDTEFGVEVDGTLYPSTTPGQVTVGTRWGGNRIPEFAVGVASVLVVGTEAKAGELCDARMLTVMWLAVGTDPTPTATFRDVRLDDSLSGAAVILAPTDPLSMTAQQTEVFRAMLKQPKAEITAKVKAHWAELTSSKTSTAQAARLLGVAVPKGAEQCEE